MKSLNVQEEETRSESEQSQEEGFEELLNDPEICSDAD